MFVYQLQLSSPESGSGPSISDLIKYPVGDQSNDAVSDQAKDPANDKAREDQTSFVQK